MTEEDSDLIRNGFIRQRRNLIVISLVLLFAETSELSINKLNVFGNELLIRSPFIVTVALWITYFYWLWRYYVYFHDLGDKGFGNKFGTRLSVLVDQWSKKKFDMDSTWRQGIVKEARDQLTKAQAGNTNLQNVLNSPHDWRLTDAGPTGKRIFREISVQARLGLFVMRNGNQLMEHQAYWRFVVDGLDAIVLNTRASLYVLAHTRILSEYFLPYLIASAPLLYDIYRMFAR